MSVLHSYCQEHGHPCEPYHTPEHWWLVLEGTDVLCDVCGEPAIWVQMDYTQEARQ